MTSYRTTKIPEFYFNKIEEFIKNSSEFVSVSEFIRIAINEKLSNIDKRDIDFLLIKDIVFNEENILNVHSKFKVNEKDLLKQNSLRKIIEISLDLNFLNFISKFVYNFAKIHPFNDGNKRTSWILIDIFLRLNNKKLKLDAKKNIETKDEIFIWQNSNNQKRIVQIKEFLSKKIVSYDDNSYDLNKEIEKSIKENKLLLEKLSR